MIGGHSLAGPYRVGGVSAACPNIQSVRAVLNFQLQLASRPRPRTSSSSSSPLPSFHKLRFGNALAGDTLCRWQVALRSRRAAPSAPYVGRAVSPKPPLRNLLRCASGLKGNGALGEVSLPAAGAALRERLHTSPRDVATTDRLPISRTPFFRPRFSRNAETFFPDHPKFYRGGSL